MGCLSCTPDALPRIKPPFPFDNRLRFGSQDALALLKKCTNFKRLNQIHARIIRNGLSNEHLIITKLIRLSSSYGEMDYASLLFNQITNPPTFTWNLMIRAYNINGSSRQALLLYNLMICKGVPPDKFTFPFVIKACENSCLIDKGKEVHVLAIKCGFSDDIYLHNTLVGLYLKCGDFDYGRKVFVKMRVRNVVSWTTMISGLVSSGELDAARVLFEEMPVRNVVSWTAMIDGYARSERPQEAFELFWKMQMDNVRPNEFTLVSLLIACTQLGSLRLGRWIHHFALHNGFEIGGFIGTALIDMYSKCGSLEDAKRVFDNMEVKSLAAWNSMITSLGVHGCGEKALTLFAEMEMANVEPDAITFVGVLSASVNTNNVDRSLRYFQYMIEFYGITPIDEHYSCMIELCRRAKMLLEARESVNSVPI